MNKLEDILREQVRNQKELNKLEMERTQAVEKVRIAEDRDHALKRALQEYLFILKQDLAKEESNEQEA